MSTASAVHAIRLPKAAILLETFPRNACAHAVLRITACPYDSAARQATFSKDELAAHGIDPAALHALDDVQYEQNVVCLPGVRGAHAASVRLELREPVPVHVFVERVWTYTRFYEACASREKAAVQGLLEKREALRERVVGDARERVNGDDCVRQGLEALMESKKGYFG